ncbi:MAG: PEP-CTERM sorting domain-containing protein [Acidobacteria bacterium]|nr:PEP-CTERM sorting domain-containing protein [Acidobacteriota bacterium]
MSSKLRAAFLSAAFLLSPALRVDAAALMLSISDPVGDSTGVVDATGLTMWFDNTTGDYTIKLTADAANPFIGTFRINLNLFNPDTGSVAQDPSYFVDTMNDYDLASPVTEIILTGTNTRLISWGAGDRVAYTSTPLGNPTGIALFRSGVWSPLPLAGTEDMFGTWSEGDYSVIAANPMPEPGSLGLLAGGLFALFSLRARRK